jgi:hypothetical protein
MFKHPKRLDVNSYFEYWNCVPNARRFTNVQGNAQTHPISNNASTALHYINTLASFTHCRSFECNRLP